MPGKAVDRSGPGGCGAAGAAPSRWPLSARRRARRSACRCLARWRLRAMRPTSYARARGPPSAGLLVRRVPAAPAAVLAQLDPVGIVALRLLALVIAPLALLARECDGDSDVSAGHRYLEVDNKRPASARLEPSLARRLEGEPPIGLEPMTPSLPWRCSTN